MYMYKRWQTASQASYDGQIYHDTANQMTFFSSLDISRVPRCAPTLLAANIAIWWQLRCCLMNYSMAWWSELTVLTPVTNYPKGKYVMPPSHHYISIASCIDLAGAVSISAKSGRGTSHGGGSLIMKGIGHSRERTCKLLGDSLPSELLSVPTEAGHNLRPQSPQTSLGSCRWSIAKRDPPLRVCAPASYSPPLPIKSHSNKRSKAVLVFACSIETKFE